jgi:hypothetical protein
VTASVWIANEAWRERLRAAGLGRPHHLLEAPPVAGPDAASRTSRTDRILVGGLSLHRKVYRYPTGRDLRRALFRGILLGSPRARREWRALLALRADDVPAVEAVALVVERRLGLVRRTALLTRTVDGASALDDLLSSDSGSGRRLDALSRAASSVAAAHAAGHELGSPALRDLVLADSGPAWILDLPRHRKRSMDFRRSTRDLARFAAGLALRASGGERRRTLGAYLERRGVAWDLEGTAAEVHRAARPWLDSEGRRIRR